MPNRGTLSNPREPDMTSCRPSRAPRELSLVLLLAFALAGCSSDKIFMAYPDEAVDFSLAGRPMPALYIDTVTDMRPIEQREGQGSFFKITFPDDASWEAPATTIYAEALAQDLEQTQLVELVPLHAQADYVLSVDLLSMANRLERSPASFLLTGALGAGLGLVLGEDGSDKAKLAAGLGAISILAVPVPTRNRAEAAVRMTLKDRQGEVLWQKTCYGEYEGKSYMTPTARQDQKLVNEYLTKAVKRANGCLLGQLRQQLLERAG
jgi:hypothetical protein